MYTYPSRGVAPVVRALTWLFVLLDFFFRAVVPLWNGWVHLLSQILRRLKLLILPYSFTHVDVLKELLQGLALSYGTLGQNVVTWLGNLESFTLQYEVVTRQCAGGNSMRDADCIPVFSPVDACYAASNQLAVDLLTSGLFAWQSA
jgi:hypothetical protein